MKLYTEEQVRLLLGEHLSEYQIDKRLNDTEHIELPSDEEVRKESLDKLLTPISFQLGANWVINHIKQQDNDTN